MLVYADAKRFADPRVLLRALADELAAQRSASDCDPRRLTTALLDAGELAQGLIDSERERSGVDELTGLSVAATALVQVLGEAFVAGDARRCSLDLHALEQLSLPERVTISRPEGFAFYAVYPHAWARAAGRFASERTRVIGIRSIGLTLAAVVAAAADAELLVSVRPVGHPFARTLALGCELARQLLADKEQITYLVVDEGPGLSGSSFAAVATWLCDRGVPESRVVFMPSHAGEPGPQASKQVRRIWAKVRREVPEVRSAPDRFAGALDLSAGEWRRELYGREPWPPANPQQERRKLLLPGQGQLAKFAGLGRYGVEKLALARTLADAGWIAKPLALEQGFLISEWIADAVPLDHSAATFDRARLLGHIADYISFRATTLPAPEHAGASVELLFEMLIVNAEEALGPEAGARFRAWQPALAQLGSGLRPCRSDNRMHRWEWLITSKSTFIKCDALDHHASHDLVGAQDPLWDLVGVRHEWALDDHEFALLVGRVGQKLGREWAPAQIDFFTAAYLAFQCGAATLAAETAPRDDALLLRREAARYASALTKAAPSGP